MSTPKPWSRIGAWAAEAEAAEAEEQAAAAAAAAAATDTESFPSLKEAASSKSKKKKAAPMSLSTFYSSSTTAAGPVSVGLTPDELLRLPTGPRERSQEEIESSRGFRSYGLSTRRDDAAGGAGRRGFGGFEDEVPRRERREFEQPPSRADEVDNWGSMKKPMSQFSGDSGRAAPSRADEVDNWGSMKKNLSQFSGDLGRAAPSRADEADNWTAAKRPMPPPSRGFGSGFRESAPSDSSDRWSRGPAISSLPSNGERPRLVLEPRKVGVTETATKTTKPSPFGAARPREEVLAEKGMDWKRMEAEIEVKKVSRPSSSHSSRAGSPVRQLGEIEQVVKPRQKVNPFGDAKPREVVLQEQGKDWKKIEFELEHRAVDRLDTEEEKKLKDEIKLLNELLTKDQASKEIGNHERFSPEDLDSLRQKKENLEQELEQLARELDDKVRFGQKAGDRRPGSGSGRPSSQSGASEDGRSVDFSERPWSHGGGVDTWTRSGDDHRSYNFGNRNIERPQPRERW